MAHLDLKIQVPETLILDESPQILRTNTTNSLVTTYFSTNKAESLFVQWLKQNQHSLRNFVPISIIKGNQKN
jgi:hypothetical protein